MKWQITQHWSNNLRLEMRLDKLQLITTAIVATTFKIRWLRWWNSNSMIWNAKNFPNRPMSDKELESWPNKASFYAGVSSQSLKFLSFLHS
jgi:hypothetical protein